MSNDNQLLDVSGGITIGVPPVVVSAPAPMPTDATAALTREQVSAEVQRIATDATHPHHVGYKAGTQAARDYVDSLYRRVASGVASDSAPKAFDVESGLTIVNGEVKSGRAPDDTPATTTIDLGSGAIIDSLDNPREDAAFRDTAARAIANELPMTLRDGAAAESERLFTGSHGEALEALVDMVTPERPQAAIRSRVEFARFMADLHELRAKPTGAPVALEQLPEAVDAECERLGIDLGVVDRMREHLFATKPELLQHVVNHLNAFPPGARVAAHVRACQALVTLSRLYQSVT